MEDKLVILKYYETIVEAEVDINVLQTNNIECTLDTDDTIVIYPLFSDAEKGIKIYIFEKDFNTASQLIEEFHTNFDNVSEERVE